MFAATLGAGVLAALATFLAVWFTNRKTAETYKNELRRQENEREIQRKEKALVIIKPRTMRNTFEGVLDTLIMRNSLDRVLLFSGSDGFEFINQSTAKDDGKQYAPIWRFLFIENDSLNDIYSVKLTTHSRLETTSNAIYEYSATNFLALLRSKESIVIRLENLEQWEKLNDASEFTFEATIEYLTVAQQQICYKFEVKVKNFKTEVLKDEYAISDDITLPGNNKTTVYRNLQDDIAAVDRSAYAWEKIGAAQSRGFIHSSQPSRPNSSDFDSLMGIAEKLIGFFLSNSSNSPAENQTEALIENLDKKENESH